MRSGPTKQKGKAVSPTQGKTRNQPVTNFVQKGRGGYFANSRTDVHPNFDRHASVGRKSEPKERRN
jgi:hypothetical protein